MAHFGFINHKTGTRQCTRAVWSTFAEIRSNHPGALMYYIWGYWNFRLEFVTHTSQHTRDLPNLSRSLKTPGLPITSGTLSACRSFEAKND